MRKPSTLTSTLITAAALCATVFMIGCTASSNESAGGGNATPPLAVQALIVQPIPLEDRITTTGALLANEEVELRSEVAGRVTGVFFDEGSEVKAGQLLLKINDSELQAELKRKQLQEKLASDDESRKKSLADMKGISKEEYDRSLNALNIIRAELDVIKSQIAKTEVRAPFDGVVGLRYVSAGSYISPSALAATMQDTDPIKVEFSVPEKYALRLKTGATIEVMIGENEAKFIGSIYAIEAKVDPGTRTIKARAKIPNPDARLVPGQFCKIEIVIERIEDALVIPTAALVPQLEGEKVFTYKGGNAQSVQVNTGIRTARNVQTTSGLNPGDTIVTTGLLQISEGRPLSIQRFDTLNPSQ